MPTYPYACTACDNRFEVVQAFTDDALTVCEQCGGRLRKVFSSVGVVFKGSGFYRNDSRASGASGGSGGGEGGSDSKSDKSAGTETPAASTTGKDSSSGGSGSGSNGTSTTSAEKGSGAKKQSEPSTASPTPKGSSTAA